MKNKKRLTVVEKLQGMRLWEVIIGPAGVGLQFGKRKKVPKLNTYEGEISLWIQTQVEVYAENKVVVRSLFPQKPTEIDKYRKYLNNKIVKRAEVLSPGNILQVLLTPNIILRVFPGSQKSELRWNIYDNRIANPPGILVYKSAINVVR